MRRRQQVADAVPIEPTVAARLHLISAQNGQKSPVDPERRSLFGRRRLVGEAALLGYRQSGWEKRTVRGEAVRSPRTRRRPSGTY